MEHESNGGDAYQKEARAQAVIELRDKGFTLIAIAAIFNITRERVRQIEVNERRRLKNSNEKGTSQD